MYDGHARRGNLYTCRVTAGKDYGQLHVIICFYCTFYAAAKIAVAQDTDSNTHWETLPCLLIFLFITRNKMISTSLKH